MWIRHRQQAKTDQNPPKIARASAGPAEHQHADQDQGRSDLRDIEGQDLDGQRRVDVGSMHDDEGGTRSTSPPAAKRVTISPLAILLCRMAVTPMSAYSA
jgi:hypothetical protein